MAEEKPPLEGITGFLGVGSLELLGVFFILDGTLNFLSFIQMYAATSAWAILVTAPLLTVSYVFGLLSSLGSELAVERLVPSRLTPELFARVMRSGNDYLMRRYIDAEYQTRLLHGCVFAFALVAAGSFMERRMMGQFWMVAYVGLVGGLCVSVICPLIARHIQTQLVEMVEATHSHRAMHRTR
ncbi:MAG: hypothetical protein M3N97_12400 [Pseudomonadota bacterium]|nr:hypothetical protein [Pseudomonadota bacterium]